MIEGLYLTPNIPPAWLKLEWLWIAEYAPPPADGSIPDWIVPAGIPKSQIALFQYTDDGVVSGIPNNNVDLNIISPGFVDAINLQEPAGGSTMRYQMTTRSNTNLRPDHNTNNTSLGTVPGNVIVQGDVIFTAPQNLFNASGTQYQKTGDVWLQTTQVINGVSKTGWMAYIHLGVTQCDNFIDNGEPTTPPPATTLPEIHLSSPGNEYYPPFDYIVLPK
jgi:hypothetical protein